MKLSNVCDEDLRKVALLKTRKGIATSEAKRAQQILYSRNSQRMPMHTLVIFRSTTDGHIERQYKTFAEENDGLTLEEYLKRRN